VNASLEQLDPSVIFKNDYLKQHSFVKYYFLDPTGINFDYMTTIAFSSTVLLPCPWVLYQWFLLLFQVHWWYSSILQKAILKPNSKGAKKILHAIVPYLQFASHNIQYGLFQNHQVKPKLQETFKHYGSYMAIITLSFNDLENPISSWASFHTIANTQFPAVFDKDSIQGQNGSEFMQNLLSASVEEATINILLH